MTKPLIIFGAGGLGREVKTIVDTLPEWYVVGFCDDRIPAGTMIMGVPVIGDSSHLKKIKNAAVVIAIGNPVIKREVALKLAADAAVEFVTLVHPRAVLGDIDTIRNGKGSVITAGCILTTSVHVGDHVLLNLNTTVGHDASIGNFCSIMPGVNIAGQVEIGEAVMIGSGANILNRVHVQERAVVGSGAVVLNDVLQGRTVVGIPAKEVIRHQS